VQDPITGYYIDFLVDDGSAKGRALDFDGVRKRNMF
jgi:hypothetical protein